MTDPEWNSTKEKFSIAYLHAINAKVNYAMNKAEKDFDGMQIDYTMSNRTVGLGRTVSSPSDMINIQLKSVSKSSSSMLRENDTEIMYRLNNSITAIGNHYLVVMVLPEEEVFESWLNVTEDEMVLKKCAYYIKIHGVLGPGFITIPKTNLFNPENLISLFSDYTIDQVLL